jgi:hypothetical protein
MNATTFQYTTQQQPPAVEVKTIGEHTYRIGTRAMGGFFVRESRSGSRLDFYSREALDWFIDQLERAANPPLPPVIASVAASQDRKVENIIRIPQKPTKVVGTYYPDSFALEDLIVSFLDQYGALPTRIAFNDTDDTYRFAEYAGIAVVKSRTVPSRQIHLMFDPAKAVCGE